jgi:chaperone modulatory protein CbpM
MALTEQDLVVEVRNLSLTRLHKWIRLGWVRPERHEGAARFHDIDVARVRLLNELERELDLDDDTVPLLLSLLDQIHGLRRELRNLAQAVDEHLLDAGRRVNGRSDRI